MIFTFIHIFENKKIRGKVKSLWCILKKTFFVKGTSSHFLWGYEGTEGGSFGVNTTVSKDLL